MSKYESFTVIIALVESINRGDIDSAIECYEPDAKYVSESGKILKGTGSIRKILENFITIKPKLVAHIDKMIEGEDFTICFFRWELSGFSKKGKFKNIEGLSTNILRKNNDGNWRISIDSPWGASILL